MSLFPFPDPVLPSTNVDVIVATDKDGNTVDLSTIVDEQYKEGIDGRFMAPVQHYSESVPEQDGARYRGTRVLPNLLSIPITIVADDIATLRAKVRELVRALSPKKGPHRLTVYTADGLVRYVTCVLESQIERDPAVDGECYDAAIVLNFRAFDPFWYDEDPVSKPFSIVTSPGTFFPAPPFRLGASTVFSGFTETNEGDVEAWPVWVVTGPGSDVRLENETTGQSLTIAGPVLSGTTITVDTRPGVKAVYRQDGANLFSVIEGDLWALAPGDNDIRVQIVEATAATHLNLEYRPGYMGV